jgi:predicted nucleic acid-binding protein
MSSSPLRCVVDASVAIKLFLLENGIPLVTADEKLVRLLAGTPYSVEALRTFPIPTPD